jgi:hypothetical protein
MVHIKIMQLGKQFEKKPNGDTAPRIKVFSSSIPVAPA